MAHRKGTLLIKWVGAEDCVKLPMFKLHSDPGKVNLQFKFYCNNEFLEGLLENPGSLEIEEDEELIDAVEENQDNCSNCKSSTCRDGQYLMDFSEVRVDLRLKYVGQQRIDQSNKSGSISKVHKSTF